MGDLSGMRSNTVSLRCSRLLTTAAGLVAATLIGRALPADASAALSASRVNGITGVTAPSRTTTARAARPSSAADTVRGVVFDSLAMEPLVEAFVLAEPGGVSVTTDSLGAFTLVSETPIARLTVYHDVLDETGVGALIVARPEGAAAWTGVVIATPSLESLWPSVCGEQMPDGDNRAIIIGSARLPDDRTRVSGAAVRVQWEAILPRTRLLQTEERDAVTDESGAYALCGLPVNGELAMIGASTELQSGVLEISLEDRPLRRVDLVLAPADGPVDRWPTIGGRVVNPDGGPIAGAEVIIDGVDQVIVTDSAGRFTVAQVPPGSRMLAAQAAGFTSVVQPVDVLYENTADVRVALAPGLGIAGLEGLAVTERRVLRRDREEFESRRRDGLATFVDTAAVREAGSWRQALDGVAGLVINTAPGEDDPARFAVYARGRGLGVTTCTATVLVDGLPATLPEFHSVAPDQFFVAEIYRSATFAPDRFVQFADSDCALVIFWTHFGLRP
jgi:hypothetical protein